MNVIKASSEWNSIIVGKFMKCPLWRFLPYQVLCSHGEEAVDTSLGRSVILSMVGFQGFRFESTVGGDEA